MKLEELKVKYGSQWEFFPDLAIGVAAARWRVPSSEEYARGLVPVLLAGDLSGLVAQLDEQAKRVRRAAA